MSRILYILIIALSCFTLSASVWVGETEDVQQIRDVFYKEVEGWRKGDPEQIISGYAPGFVGYRAFGRGPEDWVVVITGLDSLRTKYAAWAVGGPALWAKHPNWSQGGEVRHVHVEGNHALMVTKQWYAIPDSTARQTIRDEHQSVWMLAKIDGEWKITNWIMGVTASQEVRKWWPE